LEEGKTKDLENCTKGKSTKKGKGSISAIYVKAIAIIDIIASNVTLMILQPLWS
jgi:hypothetical protein